MSRCSIPVNRATPYSFQGCALLASKDVVEAPWVLFSPTSHLLKMQLLTISLTSSVELGKFLTKQTNKQISLLCTLSIKMVLLFRAWRGPHYTCLL